MKVWRSSALALAAALCAREAAAQEPIQAQADEIIVTVQKREQAVVDVPIAVTALGGDFLQDLDISNFDDLSRYTPGFLVQEQSANNTGFVVRGITSDSGEANIEPRVAVFYDGVPASRNRGSYTELFDLERVEVVKGPQATLFGRSALIGGVNVITNKADLSDFEGKATVAFGDFNFFRTEVMANLPVISDKLGVRVAYTRREREGFVENLTDGDRLGNVQVDALRFSIGYQPISRLRFDLSFGLHTDENSGTAFKSGVFAPEGSTTSPFTAAALNTFTAPGAPAFEGGAGLGLDREVRYITLLSDFEASPELKLSSISSYRYFNSVEVFDPDGSSLPILLFAEDAEGLQWSQEFRLNWDNGGPLTGFAGASVFHEDGNQRVPLQFDERTTLGLFTGAISRPQPQPLAFLTAPAVLQAQLAGLGVPDFLLAPFADALKPVHQEQFTNFSETTAFDIYADVSYQVTDRLAFTAGGRWTYEDKRTGFESLLLNGGSGLGAILAGQAPGGPIGLFFQPTAPVFQNDEFNGFAWRFVGTYALTDNANLFASYARGRRPNVVQAGTFEILPEETVDSFEVGAKANLFGNKLSLDGSGFYYLYDNFQTSDIVNGQIITINAGEANSYGFEGQAFIRPFRGVELFTTYGFNRARFQSGARDGNRFRLSPDHKLAVGGTFSREFGRVGVFSLTPSYTYQSRVFFDDDNDRSDLQQGRASPAFNDFVVDEFEEGYGLVNLRGAWESPDGRFRLGLFANNLADKEFIIDAGNTGDGFGIPTFIRGPRRTVGVELSAGF